MYYYSKFWLPSRDLLRLRFRKNFPPAFDVTQSIEIQRNLFLAEKSFIFGEKKRTTSPPLKPSTVAWSFCETDDLCFSPFPNTYYTVLSSTTCLCPPDNVKHIRTKEFPSTIIPQVYNTSIRTRFVRQMRDDVSYRSAGPSYTLIIC